MTKKWESPALMCLLNNTWTMAYFAFISLLFPGSFSVAPQTIPILLLLIVLNAAHTVTSTIAIQQTNRSTYCLIRTLTIPILALIDLCTTSSISPISFFAMVIMFLSMVWLHRQHGIEKRGVGITLFTSINAAIALALFKYVLDLGTSVAAAQLILLAPLVAGIGIWMASTWKKLKPAKRHTKLLIIQTASYGLADVLTSYALLLAPASIIVAISRSTAMLWSILFGKAVFKERHWHEKLIAGGGVIVGLVLLAMGQQ